MRDKGHFYISIMKSGLRILACGLIAENAIGITTFAILFIIAELLGVAEEVYDKR